VHTTDPQLRVQMMRARDAGALLERIQYLARGNIELHTQIVLCPGINDGAHLEKTVRDLSAFYPHVRSAAVVPVGLTKHRGHLYHLRGVDSRGARKIIGDFAPYQEQFRRTLGETFLHFADEFYILAGSDTPEAEWYDDFPQIENGVGMVREFVETFLERRDELPNKVEKPTHITVVTGVLAGGFFEDLILPAFNTIRNLRVRTAIVPNTFLGESVTVSGLLTGADILETVKDVRENEILLLPPNCLNDDGLFLDDMTVEALNRHLRTKFVVGSSDIIGTVLDVISH
jgi:putative radical SAM enzyme (TIGR03279 family)